MWSGRTQCPLWVKSRHLQCKKAVRFTPESDHHSVFLTCLLRARSGHCAQTGTPCSMRVRYIALNSL